MKYLLALLLIPCVSRAQQGVQNMHEVALTTTTIVQSISVATQTPTDVALATSSGTLSGYYSIELYNPAASASTVVCGFDLMLSTLVANAWYGREVIAGSGVYWAVPSYRKLYCQSLSTTASTRVTVTQLK